MMQFIAERLTIKFVIGPLLCNSRVIRRIATGDVATQRLARILDIAESIPNQ
jgi:hypothetical protein